MNALCQSGTAGLTPAGWCAPRTVPFRSGLVVPLAPSYHIL